MYIFTNKTCSFDIQVLITTFTINENNCYWNLRNIKMQMKDEPLLKQWFPGIEISPGAVNANKKKRPLFAFTWNFGWNNVISKSFNTQSIKTTSRVFAALHTAFQARNTFHRNVQNEVENFECVFEHNSSFLRGMTLWGKILSKVAMTHLRYNIPLKNVGHIHVS